VGDENLAEENVRKGLIPVALLMPALTVLMPLAAQAADPAYCEAYAKATIDRHESPN
jgi:hypothetical protein